MMKHDLNKKQQVYINFGLDEFGDLGLMFHVWRLNYARTHTHTNFIALWHYGIVELLQFRHMAFGIVAFSHFHVTQYGNFKFFAIAFSN